MYLDHLKNNSACAEPCGASFMECMEAALYCTEIHSAADAYLIKAEATYMASEDGEGAAKEGWWAKIKNVFQKMWDAVVGFFKKVASFITDTIKPAITKRWKAFLLKWNARNIEERLAKVKDKTPDKAKLKDVKYISYADAKAEFDKVSKTIQECSGGKLLSMAKEIPNVKDLVANMPSVDKKDASYVKSAADLNYNDAVGMAKQIANGGMVNALMANVNSAEETVKKLKTALEQVKSSIKDAEKNKNEDMAKRCMESLKGIRACITGASILANHAASFVMGVVLSQARAINAYISACGDSKPEEKKDSDKK